MADAKDPTLSAHTEIASATESIRAKPAVVADAVLDRFQKRQHEISVSESLKENWKPLAWCGYMFLICVMYGYDALAGSVVISIDAFRRDFGFQFRDQYVVSAAWQLGFQAGFFVGLMLGGAVVGPVVGRFGRKWTIAGAYLINIAGVFLQFFCSTPAELFGSKLLTGMPLGAFATVAPTYASEMSPLSVRGAITGGMNLAIVLGNTIGYGVLRESNNYEGKLSYRLLFGLQWGFIAVCLVVLPFLPESPYWFIAQNQEDKARKILEGLHSPGYDIDDQGPFKDCFNKKNWRRTTVALMAFVIQNFSGMGWVVGYMSYFMQLAGMSSAKSFDMTVVISGLMVVGNMTSWFLVEYLGRRGTLFWGSNILLACLLIIAILAVATTSQGALTAQIVLMAIWGIAYQATLGAVAWPIASENATSSLRTPTQSICTIANALTASIWGLSLPYAVNPDQGNLQGKIGFIYAALLILSIVFVYLYVPETQGRTFSEIDRLWSCGVPPRKWATYKLEEAGGADAVKASEGGV